MRRCSSGTAFGILSGMFSEAVLDHFRNPRNAGELPGATATVEVSNPVCGDILKLSARVVDGRIAEARFLCRGCTPTEARDITAESLSQSLGGLPPATFHGAQLAADAVRALIQNLASASR